MNGCLGISQAQLQITNVALQCIIVMKVDMVWRRYDEGMTKVWRVCNAIHYTNSSVLYPLTTKDKRRLDDFTNNHNASRNVTRYADIVTQMSGTRWHDAHVWDNVACCSLQLMLRFWLQPLHFSTDFEGVSFDPLLVIFKCFWLFPTNSFSYKGSSGL